MESQIPQAKGQKWLPNRAETMYTILYKRSQIWNIKKKKRKMEGAGKESENQSLFNITKMTRATKENAPLKVL